MHSQEGWAHFAADTIRQSFRARPAWSRRRIPVGGNLRLNGSGYKPSRNMV